MTSCQRSETNTVISKHWKDTIELKQAVFVDSSNSEDWLIQRNNLNIKIKSTQTRALAGLCQSEGFMRLKGQIKGLVDNIQYICV